MGGQAVRFLLLALVIAGMCTAVYGVLLIYPPAAYIVAGTSLVYVGLTTDYGGKRGETARRPPRK